MADVSANVMYVFSEEADFFPNSLLKVTNEYVNLLMFWKFWTMIVELFYLMLICLDC